MIRRILVANRGEIACRVMRTAKKMNIETVAVFSEPDRKCKHVEMADKAFLIGPAASAESYLDMNKILRVCLDEKVDAVHPGYGFLSENAKFMDALDSNGIIFIGPKKKAIEDMGDKIHSKKLAGEAGVNLIPGFVGEVGDNPSEIIKIAKEIGYPVMLKASAGGGGKGMRIAYNDKEAVEGYQLAKAEAKKSFGDDRILIEKYIEEPRHIEINVLGDQHGNIIYLPERECSVQRRNQKVVEEAPSPFIDPETRKKMGEQAVMLSRAVDYESSGTVEFMVDKHKHFYFLEMNTRLQVEHPITEMITGIDIVEEMINVAMGKPLSYKQSDVRINGHAIESRIYAEDPYRGFLPSIGLLTKYQEPSHKHIRIDTGVREGDEISMFYDPMISKTATWGVDRTDAIHLMKDALDNYIVRGVGHNISFCRDVMRQPQFVKGTYSTKFIQETYPEGFAPMSLTEKTRLEFACFVNAMRQVTNSYQTYTLDGPCVIRVFDDFYAIDTEQGTVYKIDHDGNALTDAVKIDAAAVNWDNRAPLVKGEVNGKSFTAEFLSHTHSGYQLMFKGQSLKVEVFTPQQFEFLKYMPPASDMASAKEFLAPMPGSVIEITVKAGDKVEAGQKLGILEAMKMQNVLQAERKGVVKAIHCKAGESVQVDQLLIEFD